MANDNISSEDDWISNIKSQVKKKVEEKKEELDEDTWGNFFEKLVLFLKPRKKAPKIVDAAVGLIIYGITDEESLERVADNKNEFRIALKDEGVQSAICDMLFEQYVVPTLTKKRTRDVVYRVGAIVKGAKQSKGARGNVYKFLQKHQGYYSEKAGIEISYEEDSDDLRVIAYFRDISHACEFQNALSEWEIHKHLANLDGVDINPSTPEEMDMPNDLERILQQGYDPGDSESPCHTIADLRSYHLSVPVTEPVESNNPLAKYQSVDKIPLGVKQYKCHLHDKAKNKKLQNNENNMVAASWYFHQCLDGLNTDEGIPLVVLSVKSTSEARDATKDHRFMVVLKIEFFEEKYSVNYQAPTGARLVDGVWESCVYVKDKAIFAQCVGWKENDTKKRWQEHREWLEGTASD